MGKKMNARFRVRFREGGDATVGSLEAFYELVRSDGLTGDDLVHDALTGQWVPARAHPVYWLCTDPLVSLEERPAEGLPDETPFALAEPMPGLTPDQAATAFVQRMDEERAADPELPPAIAELAVLKDGVAILEDPPAVQVVEAHMPRWTTDARDEPEDDFPEYRAEPLHVPPARPPRSVQLSLTVVLVLGSAGVAGGVGLAWPDLTSSGAVDIPVATVASRTITATEEELRGAAFSAFLGEVRRLGESFGIGPVPEIWLQGRYLADAAAYPEVGAYWMRYRDYVEVTRNQDDDLYRVAYLAGLEGVGVTGPVRSLRLATAVADFDRESAGREAVYARAAALADAALELHALSTAARGRISYQPARGNRVSADPVIEATGTDAEMQVALDAALDRVLLAVHGEVGSPGPGREGVAGWLVEALKTPATSR